MASHSIKEISCELYLCILVHALHIVLEHWVNCLFVIMHICLVCILFLSYGHLFPRPFYMNHKRRSQETYIFTTYLQSQGFQEWVMGNIQTSPTFPVDTYSYLCLITVGGYQKYCETYVRAYFLSFI